MVVLQLRWNSWEHTACDHLRRSLTVLARASHREPPRPKLPSALSAPSPDRRGPPRGGCVCLRFFSDFLPRSACRSEAGPPPLYTEWPKHLVPRAPPAVHHAAPAASTVCIWCGQKLRGTKLAGRNCTRKHIWGILKFEVKKYRKHQNNGK